MRLFVAVQPPPLVVERLAALARPARPGVRWTTPDQWHVTLRFLGDVDEPEPVIAALAAAALESTEATLGPVSKGLGRHVVAVPVEGLEELARGVVGATAPFGSPPSDRPYRGHITLARVRDGKPGRLAGEAVHARWPVEEVQLIRSRLHPDGARYEDLYVRSLIARTPA